MRTLLIYSGFVAALLYLWNIGGIAKPRPVFRRIRLRCHLALFAVVVTQALQTADMLGNVPGWVVALNIAFIVAMFYMWRQSFVLIADFERLQRR